jgi:hypothetical protein
VSNKLDKNRDYRLDKQCTTDKGLHNLQVQANNEAKDSTAKKTAKGKGTVEGTSVATCLVACDTSVRQIRDMLLLSYALNGEVLELQFLKEQLDKKWYTENKVQKSKAP